jgi:hypothetical protein
MPNPKKRVKSICLSCDAEFDWLPSQSIGKYCSNKCQQDYIYKNVIKEWKVGNDIHTENASFKVSKYIRRYLFEQANNKCTLCGWGEINPTTKKSPLEIDHIDGNCKNNRPENLRLICPNCHSLTPTYRSLNKGNGNKERYKYLRTLLDRN